MRSSFGVFGVIIAGAIMGGVFAVLRGFANDLTRTKEEKEAIKKEAERLLAELPPEKKDEKK